MWRFSLTHDGDKIDWNNGDTQKWYLSYTLEGIVISYVYLLHQIGVIYFNSKEVAEEAKKEFGKEFCAQDVRLSILVLKRSGSRKMTWTYEKFKGNGAIYAFCPKCGFYHNPSRFLSNDKGLYEVQVTYQYNYCPMCGEYLYDDIEHATCVWNERDMEELYSEEEGNKYE